jgi:uncharacterized protein with PIN domain
MCQAKPGPRCWSDSNATAKSLNARLKAAEEKLKAARAESQAAAAEGSLTRFGRLRKAEEKLVVKVNNLRREIRHNQRDLDGTKTGLKNLEAAVAVCEDSDEMKELENRKSQAEQLRMSRAHALETLTSDRRPVLRIAA